MPVLLGQSLGNLSYLDVLRAELGDITHVAAESRASFLTTVKTY